MDQLLSLAGLLTGLLGPACAVVACRRPRVVFAAAFVPVAVVLLATVASVPTDWGHAKADDDFTNTGALVYLVFFELVAASAGLVLAALAAGVTRLVRSRA